MNLKSRMQLSEPSGTEKATTFEDIIEAVNDLRAKYTAHIANTAVHTVADATNTLAGSDVKKLEDR